MMKVILIAIPTFCLFQNNYIKWSSDKNLSWQDYKGEVNNEYKVAAISNINIGVKIKSNPDEFEVAINCLFNPYKSWVLESERKSYLLNHEQKHFDLAEVYTRRIRKSIDSLKQREPFDFESLDMEVTGIYKRIKKELDSVQFKYDEETNHSANVVKQKVWNEKIDSWLSQLDDFKEESVIIARK